jgi:hypothetical protein
MYAFIVVQLKNQFLYPVFEGLRAYVLTRRMKRHARALDVTKTKKKVFQALKLKTMKSVQVCSAYDSLKRELRTKHLSHAYATWRSLFLENSYLAELYRVAQSKLVARMFSALVSYRNTKRQEKLE